MRGETFPRVGKVNILVPLWFWLAKPTNTKGEPKYGWVGYLLGNTTFQGAERYARRATHPLGGLEGKGRTGG